MTEGPIWTEAQLEAAIHEAKVRFRRERLEEPLEDYLEEFEAFQGRYEDLLERSVDLAALAPVALEILSNPRMQQAFRYLSAPPISVDDLKTLAESPSLSRKKLQEDPELAGRVVQVVLTAVGRRRFPWVREDREPSEAERETAIIASAALMATQAVNTSRRHQSKKAQEAMVRQALLGANFTQVATRTIPTSHDAPGPGEFCGESKLGTRKADFVVGLWDRRMLAIECKVSNSEVNSLKRVNNDAAAKAERWIADFGRLQVVPAAVLGGVFKLQHLQQAQGRGLSLFWAHRLDELMNWIERTRLP